MEKEIQIWHNSRCSKSREAFNWLTENKKDFETIEYMKKPVSVDDLKALLKKLDMRPLDLLRKKEKLYTSEYKGKNLSEDELLELMVQNPSLIERPVLVVKNKARIGRPLENVFELFDLK